jgi:hypothetical protein
MHGGNGSMKNIVNFSNVLMLIIQSMGNGEGILIRGIQKSGGKHYRPFVALILEWLSGERFVSERALFVFSHMG